MLIYKDSQYLFFEFFNPNNGFLIRSDSTTTGENPLMRSFPELLDVGIMGHCQSANQHICKNAGVDCYQMAKLSKRQNMSFENFCKIVNESSGKVFQIALGGAGDPNKHEYFERILDYSSSHHIVPNYTTSGYNLTEKEVLATKKYCGAVAVSFYSRYIGGRESNEATIRAINQFVDRGCKTNIHYVVSTQSIDEIIFRLENALFPKGVSAIVLLLYKPSGFGILEKTLSYRSEKLKKLIELVESKNHPYEIGFDTCFTPALLQFSQKIDYTSIDFCESARFSMYIDCEMNAFPCSFDACKKQYMFPLKDKKIIDAWNSEQFRRFRSKQENSCKGCIRKENCFGGCTLFNSVDLCNKNRYV